ncbi:MAG: hypothetical protein U9N55_07405 [candidate division Zixibacteria bacterium]|nr:hypothetical protein [candidate division Zixibacteria bacterium]
MARLAGLTILAIVHFVAVSTAQELSTDVYVSEDELFEALELEKISPSEYLILKEIITHGIDSANIHLLDCIPNLSFFLNDTVERNTNLQREQKRAFVDEVTARQTWRVRWKYAYHQKLEKDASSKYRSLAEVKFTKNLRAVMKFEREYSGRERITARSIHYRAQGKLLEKLLLGNFSKRFGLGNIVGYRGRLLNRPEHINGESFITPDYGGANGVYLRIKPNRFWSIQSLGSINRDHNHRLITTATMISRQTASLKLGGIVGLNLLKNRITEQTVRDFKLSAFAHKNYNRGHTAIEVTLQSGERPSFGGISLEGRHRFRQADIRYAGWAYNDGYLDLSAGSKTGSLSRHDSLSYVNFSFSSKRKGVEGGMFKTIIQITKRLELVNSLIASTLNRDTVSYQFLSGIVRQLQSNFTVRLDHLSKLTKRVLYATSNKIITRRTRLEGRFSSDKLSLRGYFGYNTRNGRQDYLSLFLRIRTDLKRIGRVVLWSNLGRWNIRMKRVDYWYFFISNQQEVFSNFITTIKLSNSYFSEPISRNETTVSLKVTALVW